MVRWWGPDVFGRILPHHGSGVGRMPSRVPGQSFDEARQILWFHVCARRAMNVPWMCPCLEEKELENKFERKEMKRDEKRCVYIYILYNYYIYFGRYQIDLWWSLPSTPCPYSIYISPSSHFCQNLQWKSLNAYPRHTRGQPFKKLRVELNTCYGCKWVQESGRDINYWMDWMDWMDCLVYLGLPWFTLEKPEAWMHLNAIVPKTWLKNVETC